ncbi:unnamed protein product [Aphanomyces euteiches]
MDGANALEEFSTKIRTIIEEERIALVLNADQTAINYEYLPTKTLNSCGEKTVWVKCGGKTKERATAMVLGDASGRKYPLFLILKTKQSRIKVVVQENNSVRHGFGRVVWKEVEAIQSQYGCQIYGNPSAWWNSDLSIKFLKFHFESREARSEKKVLLLWDDFSAHFTDAVMACARDLNVLLYKVPPGFTWM